MKKSDIWVEGKYLDLWSVTHFLSGVIFTGWMLVLNFESLTIFISYLLLAIGWEAFETYRGINEHTPNKVFDVVAGVFGVFAVYLFAVRGERMSFNTLILINIIYLLSMLHGFITYKKRSRKAQLQVTKD